MLVRLHLLLRAVFLITSGCGGRWAANAKINHLLPALFVSSYFPQFLRKKNNIPNSSRRFTTFICKTLPAFDRRYGGIGIVKLFRYLFIDITAELLDLFIDHTTFLYWLRNVTAGAVILPFLYLRIFYCFSNRFFFITL
jgi:hypothetical protein